MPICAPGLNWISKKYNFRKKIVLLYELGSLAESYVNCRLCHMLNLS
jgi:hypothetical protein